MEFLKRILGLNPGQPDWASDGVGVASRSSENRVLGGSVDARGPTMPQGGDGVTPANTWAMVLNDIVGRTRTLIDSLIPGVLLVVLYLFLLDIMDPDWESDWPEVLSDASYVIFPIVMGLYRNLSRERAELDG